MTLAPGVRLGAYEIVGLIGAGGMGEVYRARATFACINAEPPSRREIAKDS